MPTNGRRAASYILILDPEFITDIPTQVGFLVSQEEQTQEPPQSRVTCAQNTTPHHDGEGGDHTLVSGGT